MNYPFNLLEKLNIQTDEDHAIALCSAIKCLHERERDIIKRRFQKDQSRQEVANDYQLSYERIRQIENRALKKLSSPLLRNYIEEHCSKTKEFGRNA